MGWINDAFYVFAVFGKYTQYPHVKMASVQKVIFAEILKYFGGWLGGEFERKEDHPSDTIQLTPTPSSSNLGGCLMGQKKNLPSASYDLNLFFHFTGMFCQLLGYPIYNHGGPYFYK